MYGCDLFNLLQIIIIISMKANDHEESIVDKQAIKLKMMEEAKKLRVRQVEGPYNFDNPHLEHKTKR
jgi:hypothetical protein